MSENQKKLSNSFWVGIIILAAGSFLLLERMDLLEMPDWVDIGPLVIIAVGLAVGANRGFKGFGWLIIMAFGVFALIKDIPGWDLDHYFFPIVVITVGLFVLSRAVRGPRKEKRDFWQRENDGIVSSDEGGDDFFDIVTVFGGSKRKVFSKNFRGGEATCIFGGAEVDLSQADIQGTVVIDATQIFGGMKLLVPANWELKSDAVAIFGSVEDKRMTPQTYGAGGKKLVITGFVLFGGIDIKSF